MRIHILGASGSGTTTLAKELSKTLGYKHFDSDDYFWEPTEPPFQNKRTIEKRQELLQKDLKAHDSWILSGSLCGWGDRFIEKFDLVIYLWIPQDIRLERLKEREKLRHGDKILPQGSIHKTYVDFIEWASNYDNGDISMRSRVMHEEWISQLECKLLRIEGTYEVSEKINIVMENLKK